MSHYGIHPFEAYIFSKACNLYRLALLFRSLEGSLDSCVDNSVLLPFLSSVAW